MQFTLPELGEGIHEGELLKWKVRVGQEVRYDEPLCEIMTDKASMEIPSAFQGRVAQIHATEGKMVHVGELLLTFESTKSTETNTEERTTPNSNPKTLSSGNPVCSLSKPPLATPPASDQKVLAAPSTRRLAREQGIDLRTLQGSGPHGRILREDLTQTPAAACLRPTPPSFHSSSPPTKAIPFRGLRKKIAEKMCLSKEKVAHFTYVEEADVTQLVQLRQRAKEWGAARGIKITYLPFVLKAMVAALKQYPTLNSTLDEAKEEIVCHNQFHIGISIQTEEGLTAPVIRFVDQKSIFQLAQELQNLIERARTKKLTLEDFQGGTITLTNVGSLGGLFTTPIINYPEVAILGLNKIFRKPVVITTQGKEEIAIRDWTYFSISLDHRVIDGAIGAEFMKTFIQYIEDPSLLLLELGSFS